MAYATLNLALHAFAVSRMHSQNSLASTFIDIIIPNIHMQLHTFSNIHIQPRAIIYIHLNSLLRRLYLDLVLLYKIVHGFVDINMYDTGVSPVTERQSLHNYGVGLNVCKPQSSQRMFCFANRACKV